MTSGTDPDPIAAWVARIRLAGDEMDAWAASLHPSAWDEALADRRAAFAKLCANGPASPQAAFVFEEKPQ